MVCTNVDRTFSHTLFSRHIRNNLTLLYNHDGLFTIARPARPRAPFEEKDRDREQRHPERARKGEGADGDGTKKKRNTGRSLRLRQTYDRLVTLVTSLRTPRILFISPSVSGRWTMVFSQLF
ncbi:hypothetical protein GWI33_014615 [Rhynchophorus ferrugineus]|uniref:Uncharacterized protein n=1 Tax=Rhynchophorus ferrugineus TaxID=354439 RepID=A0A834I720_RHYFE|nr:hypothetical protein GWI33_014615 [Rhynchophorus ferrugineus]